MKSLILSLSLLFVTGCISSGTDYSNYTLEKRILAIKFMYPTKDGVYYINYNDDIDFLPLGKEFIIVNSSESKDYVDEERKEFERRIMYIISEKEINKNETK